MVAMLGLIMPAPLEMPVNVTRLPAIITERDAALGCVSVVMMASAADNQLSVCRLAMAAGKPAINFSTGSGSKITPVEKGKTCCASQPSNLDKASHVACALANPASPVPALALPFVDWRSLQVNLQLIFQLVVALKSHQLKKAKFVAHHNLAT